MSAETRITVGGTEVTVKELTVNDIRDWLTILNETPDTDTVSLLLFDDCTLSDLLLMTDIGEERLNQLTQSEIRKLIDRCKEINAPFFAFRVRMVQIGLRPTPAETP